MWLFMVGDVIYIYIYLYIYMYVYVYLASDSFLDRQEQDIFSVNADAYGRRSHLYILQLWIWLI